MTKSLKLRRGLLPAAMMTATALTAPGLSASASAEESLGKALENGKVILDARMRYETVEQDSKPEDAAALTLRTRLGYETGNFYGFKFLAEFENVSSVLEEDYNDTVNGKDATYPTIADPDTTELNRAQFTFTGVEDFTVIGGRQRINLGNQRFVGAVGWRQNEQTYDAIVVKNTMLPLFNATYAFVDKVHRVFGDDNPSGNFDTDAHLFNLDAKAGQLGNVTLYGYFLDIEQAAALSTSTYGVRVNGKHTQNDVTFSWDGEYATQSDHGDNPLEVDADFYSINVGVASQGFAGKVGYDLLGGDGVAGFSTPLATLHKWQGFADMFLKTPADGITDLHATVSWTQKDVGPVKSLKLQAWYHDFEGDNGGVDMGSEVDLLVAAGFGNGWGGSIKFADYTGEGFKPDTQKLWLSLGYKY